MESALLLTLLFTGHLAAAWLEAVDPAGSMGFEESMITLRERLSAARPHDPCYTVQRIVRDVCGRLLWHKHSDACPSADRPPELCVLVPRTPFGRVAQRRCLPQLGCTGREGHYDFVFNKGDLAQALR